MSDDDRTTEHELAESMGSAGKVMDWTVLGSTLAEEGGMGASLEAAGSVLGPIAEVGAAFALGYEAGSWIEEKTHIGEMIGDAVYDAVHPDPEAVAQTVRLMNDPMGEMLREYKAEHEE